MWHLSQSEEEKIKHSVVELLTTHVHTDAITCNKGLQVEALKPSRENEGIAAMV